MTLLRASALLTASMHFCISGILSQPMLVTAATQLGAEKVVSIRHTRARSCEVIARSLACDVRAGELLGGLRRGAARWKALAAAHPTVARPRRDPGMCGREPGKGFLAMQFN